MRKYPGSDFSLWVGIERDVQNVKNLSYFGELKEHEIVLMDAVASLLKGKTLGLLENLSLRECEAFLRDKNSEAAIEGLGVQDEAAFKKLFGWLRLFPVEGTSVAYSFDSQKRIFRSLKLVDKVKELKAFFNSPEVLQIYQGMIRPELVDVDELTVYVQAPYQSEKEREAFEELHLAGVATFQDENLNFIPEG